MFDQVLTSRRLGGLGEAFVKYYASQNYEVFGIVRNKKSAEEKFAKDGLKNVTFVQADVADSKAMLAAADEVSKTTGGSLDVLIANAAVACGGAAGEKNRHKSLPNFSSLEDLGVDLNETFNINVTGAAFTIGAFLPLIRKGQTKKIAVISTGMAMDQWTNELEIPIAATYSVSKAALNMLVVKYSVALKKESILVFGISPGTYINGQKGNSSHVFAT